MRHSKIMEVVSMVEEKVETGMKSRPERASTCSNPIWSKQILRYGVGISLGVAIWA